MIALSMSGGTIGNIRLYVKPGLNMLYNVGVLNGVDSSVVRHTSKLLRMRGSGEKKGGD